MDEARDNRDTPTRPLAMAEVEVWHGTVDVLVVAHFDWLVSRGVPFKDAMHEHRVTQPANDDCLYGSGNEKSWPYREMARPAPGKYAPMRLAG